MDALHRYLLQSIGRRKNDVVNLKNNGHRCDTTPFRYAVLFRDEKPIGIVFLQTYWVRMQDSINKNKTEKPKNKFSWAVQSLSKFEIDKFLSDKLLNEIVHTRSDTFEDI